MLVSNELNNLFIYNVYWSNCKITTTKTDPCLNEDKKI